MSSFLRISPYTDDPYTGPFIPYRQFFDVMFHGINDGHFRECLYCPDEERCSPIDVIQWNLNRRDKLSFFCAIEFLMPDRWFDYNYLAPLKDEARKKFHSLGFKKALFDDVMNIKGVDRRVVSFLDCEDKGFFSNALMKNTNFKTFLRNQFNCENCYVDIKPFAYCFETTRLVTVKDEGGEAVMDEKGREIKVIKTEVTQEKINLLVKIFSTRWGREDFSYHPALDDKGIQELINTFIINEELMHQFTVVIVTNNKIIFVSAFTGNSYCLDLGPLSFFFQRSAKRRKREIERENKSNGWGVNRGVSNKKHFPLNVRYRIENNWQNVINLTDDDDADH